MFIEILTISIALGSLAASYFFRPKEPVAVSPQQDDPKYPTCEEGDAIPVVFGTAQIDRPQLLWYGNVEIVPVKDFKDNTTGYAYNAWFSYGLCLGQLDRMVAFLVDGVVQSMSSINDQDSVYPQKYRFRCEASNDRGYAFQRAGYITLGEPTVGANTGVGYLINANTGSYGGLVPGNFGLAVAEMQSVYVGQSAYPVTFGFRVQRIHKLLTGANQWYDDKAEIPIGRNWWEDWEGALVPSTDATEYQDPGYDVSVAWGPPSPGGFGNNNPGGLPSIGSTVGTPDTGDKLWVRGDLGPIEAPTLAVMMWHTSKLAGDTLALWWNGASLPIFNISDNVSYSLVDASTINQGGTNMVAFRVTSGAGDTDIYAALAVVANDATIDLYAPGWSSGNPICMNPVHMIREALTNGQVGLGYLDADIDDVSFEAAADTLYTERFGMCLNWDKAVEVGEFIGTILKHIDARLYVDRTTGKFTLKLIRQDYTVGALLVLDDTNTVTIENATRRATGELVNAVRVEYQNSLSGDKGSVVVHDPGLIQAQGQMIPTKIEYAGITTYQLAARIALRDLRVLSSRLLTCSIKTNRATSDINIGDPFLLTSTNLGIEETVMRVIGIDLGDGISNQITIQAVEDAFATPTFSIVGKSTSRWLNPSQEPPPASTVISYDAPYHELRRLLGQYEADNLVAIANPDSDHGDGGVMVAAVQPSGSINASIYSRVSPAEYAGKGQMDFCPSCVPSQEILISDIYIQYTLGVNMSAFTPGSLAIIGSPTTGVREIVYIYALDEITQTLTVGRGVLDTVPVAHPVADTWILCTRTFVGSDMTSRSWGEVVDIKVCPRTSRGEALLAEAPVVSVDLGAEFIRRGRRPYPPGNIRVNDLWFREVLPATGTLTVSWKYRDRLNPTVYDFTAGTVVPVSGQGAFFALLKWYDDQNALLRQLWKVYPTETSSYTNAEELSDRGSGDSNFSSVSCLLHCDGADKSKNLFDSGPLGINFSMLGTAEITTTSSKFGGSSFNPGTKGATTWTTTPFQFGSGNFTIEAWVYITGGPITDWSVIASHNVGDSGSGVVSWMLVMTETGQIRFYWSTNGSTWNGGSVRQTSSALAPGIWHHIAFVRSGTVGTLYVNGSYTGPGGVLWQTGGFDQPASITGSLYAATAPVNIGIDGNGTRPFHGYIDDVRITKGVARTITVPTSRFPEGSPGLSTSLRLTVEGFEEIPGEYGDNLVSLHKHDWTMYRFGYGVGYGKSYGGTT